MHAVSQAAKTGTLASCLGPIAISRMAQLVGVHVSTVHRLLGTLADRGDVRHDPDSSRYHLGSRIFTWRAPPTFTLIYG